MSSPPRKTPSTPVRASLHKPQGIEGTARRVARGTPPEAQAAGGWFRRSGCDNPRTVLEHWEAWGTRDEHAIMSYFSDDAIYHNIPVAPIVGAVAIRSTVRAFLQLFVSVQVETLSMTSHDEVVHTERINHYQGFNGNVVALPVAGALYLSRGLIYLWRDYFDLASFETQSGVKFG
jgi:limonene-1,2-epoxide hydrolase